MFKFLGLSVGVLSSESSNLAQRIAALACDVTYTTGGQMRWLGVAGCTGWEWSDAWAGVAGYRGGGPAQRHAARRGGGDGSVMQLAAWRACTCANYNTCVASHSDHSVFTPTQAGSLVLACCSVRPGIHVPPRQHQPVSSGCGEARQPIRRAVGPQSNVQLSSRHPATLGPHNIRPHWDPTPCCRSSAARCTLRLWTKPTRCSLVSLGMQPVAWPLSASTSCNSLLLVKPYPTRCSCDGCCTRHRQPGHAARVHQASTRKRSGTEPLLLRCAWHLAV